MNYKEGDTVYLKVKVIMIDNSDGTASLEFDDGQGYWMDERICFTREKMLEELNKPELPKVGEVYRLHSNLNKKYKIVYVTKGSIAYVSTSSLADQIFTNDLQWFSKNFTKVEE